MRVTYDKSANAAYIYIADHISEGDAKKTYLCDPVETGGMINLDFDEEGLLLGIEVLDADKRLPMDVLKKAEIIG